MKQAIIILKIPDNHEEVIKALFDSFKDGYEILGISFQDIKGDK